MHQLVKVAIDIWLHETAVIFIDRLYKRIKLFLTNNYVVLAITAAQQLLPPIPAPQCPTLPPPLNGRVSASGGTATYTCSTGYTLSGSSTRTCQTGNGAWSGTAPTCGKIYQ